jgi:hypothetical protein
MGSMSFSSRLLDEKLTMPSHWSSQLRFQMSMTSVGPGRVLIWVEVRMEVKLVLTYLYLTNSDMSTTNAR